MDDKTLIERWTIYNHQRGESEVRGPFLSYPHETRVVRASEYDALAKQLQGAVGALVKIATTGPNMDMRGVALNELKRLGINPETFAGQ